MTITAQEKVLAAFFVGLYMGSTIVAALTAYGFLRVRP